LRIRRLTDLPLTVTVDGGVPQRGYAPATIVR
jgi:hypothetical protein